MTNLSNKVVLITGGNGNLGSSVVRAFANTGAKLVLSDRATGRLATLFPDLADTKEHYFAEGVDVGSETDIAKLVTEVRERFGRIDVLVNTVGGWEGMKLTHETSLETWDKMMNLNGRVIFNVCRAVLPLMIEQQGGNIINVGARQSGVISEKEAVFAASKSALAHLTEIMASEYKQYNINVNAVLPSIIDSAQLRTWMPNVDPAQWIKPEEVAAVILFLASDAATVINGALIPIYSRFV